MKYLFLNNENIDVSLPPYLRVNMTIWLKKQITDFDISCQQTYAKLAPDSILNNKIREIMRYTGGHRTSPFQKQNLCRIPVLITVTSLNPE